MTDATAMLKELSLPWQPGEFVKDVLTRVAPLAGLTHSRAFDIWYRKARKVDEAEIAQIADALNKKHERAMWNEFDDIKTRIARFEARYGASRPNFARSNADGDRPQLRVAG